MNKQNETNQRTKPNVGAAPHHKNTQNPTYAGNVVKFWIQYLKKVTLEHTISWQRKQVRTNVKVSILGPGALSF